MKYIKNGKLQDKAIERDLHIAAENFANGEIAEVRDNLLKIINAIDEFEDTYGV